MKSSSELSVARVIDSGGSDWFESVGMASEYVAMDMESVDTKSVDTSSRVGSVVIEGVQYEGVNSKENTEKYHS